MHTNSYSEITPELLKLSKLCEETATIDPALYSEYDVKRGLRDLNGKGVLVGLTQISDVCATKIENGERVPADGELYYRGYNVKDIVTGIEEQSHFGFEESTYLLLFGTLPTKRQLDDFTSLLSEYRTLPTSFVRDIIMKAPSKDMMNTLARSVLTLYSYDEKADDISIPNVLRNAYSSSAFSRFFPFTDIRHTSTITMAPACLSISRDRNIPPLRISFIF